MPPRKPRPKTVTGKVPATPAHNVKSVLATLERHASARVREEMGTRYGIHARKAYGVRVSALRSIAKKLGENHTLADALWKTGWYEARMLACFVDAPERVTPAQMDRWCRDFDNWAICDTACFHLFDRTPHALGKVRQWAKRRGEFEKRAAFALLASVALHDKQAEDAVFIKCLPLIDSAATDDRNFVKKAVNWALRAIGGRRSPALKTAALRLATRLADDDDPTARWIGKDALRQLARRAA